MGLGQSSLIYQLCYQARVQLQADEEILSLLVPITLHRLEQTVPRTTQKEPSNIHALISLLK